MVAGAASCGVGAIGIEGVEAGTSCTFWADCAAAGTAKPIRQAAKPKNKKRMVATETRLDRRKLFLPKIAI